AVRGMATGESNGSRFYGSGGAVRDARVLALGNESGFRLLRAVGDEPALQVVGRDADGHAVTLDHADAELAHLSVQPGQHLVVLAALHLVVAAGQHFGHDSLQLDQVFLAHPLSLARAARAPGGPSSDRRTRALWGPLAVAVHHTEVSMLAVPLLLLLAAPVPVRPVHTFSIVARDPATGELGVAVQSHWFSVGSEVTWAEAGVGAVATQSFVDPSDGPLGLRPLR